MASRDERDYMTVQEWSDLYGVKQSWIYDQIQAGRVAAYQFPGKRGMLVLRSEVDAFMRPKRINPPGSDSEADCTGA